MAAFPALDIAPRDVVRCISAAGWNAETFPLSVGHIYTVRAVQGAEDADAAMGLRGPVVFLDGFVEPFLAFRFKVVAKAPANDEPCAAVTIPHRMAQVFRACFDARGYCDVHDLARAGFTAAQITEYADEARWIAGPLPADGGEAA